MLEREKESTDKQKPLSRDRAVGFIMSGGGGEILQLVVDCVTGYFCWFKRIVGREETA